MLAVEHQIILRAIGEELYHDLVCQLNGIQVSFTSKKPETIHHYYKKGMSIKEIAMKVGCTESHVYRVLGNRFTPKEQIKLFEN